jgi:hypothetical protein
MFLKDNKFFKLPPLIGGAHGNDIETIYNSGFNFSV